MSGGFGRGDFGWGGEGKDQASMRACKSPEVRKRKKKKKRVKGGVRGKMGGGDI